MSSSRGSITFWGFIHQIIQKLLNDVVLSASEALFYEGTYQRYIGIRATPNPMYPKKAHFRNSYIIMFETTDSMYVQTVVLEKDTSNN